LITGNKKPFPPRVCRNLCAIAPVDFIEALRGRKTE
jgi:hypothetical protein